MPYIDPKEREQYEDGIALLYENLPDGPKGHLTYVLFSIAKDWTNTFPNNYQTISDACAALRDAEHELRRRILDPYEDNKREINGDCE